MDVVGRRQPRRRLRAPAFVLVALIGTWLGHTLIWSATGAASPSIAAVHSVHNYLRPVGALLVALTAITSWVAWRTVRRLEASAGALRARLRQAWRSAGGPASGGVLGANEAPATACPPSLGGLWASLALVQLCVYLVQENLEALAAHVAAPGISVLTRDSATPVIVHLSVALTLAVVVWVVLERLAEGREAVVHAARLFHALTQRRAARAVRFPTPAPSLTPAERFGLTSLPRPPPLLAG